MNKLFTAFGMIDSSRNINKSGTGMSLYLSNELCDLIKCEWTVESHIGKGSTFTITFPTYDELPSISNTHKKSK